MNRAHQTLPQSLLRGQSTRHRPRTTSREHYLVTIVGQHKQHQQRHCEKCGGLLCRPVDAARRKYKSFQNRRCDMLPSKKGRSTDAVKYNAQVYRENMRAEHKLTRESRQCRDWICAMELRRLCGEGVSRTAMGPNNFAGRVKALRRFAISELGHRRLS